MGIRSIKPHGWNPNNHPTDETEKAARVNRKMLAKVRGTLGKALFVENAVAAWYCARNPATPKYVKAAIVSVLVYFIMPIDAIHDVLAQLGYTDDATVFCAVYRIVSKHIMEAYLAGAHAYFNAL